MEEKNINKETPQDIAKLEWEAPKLFCLDKGKTENGTLGTAPSESVSYHS